MERIVLIIGGGVAGLSVAAGLSDLGIRNIILEKEETVGGHLRNWDRLFPNRRKGSEVLGYLTDRIDGLTEIRMGQKIDSIRPDGQSFTVEVGNGEPVTADAIVLATGFDLFDARKKEEYGYGIYDNVITSADLEMIFQSGRPLTTAQGTPPKRVGFVHCVGSRDEKAGNLYCSKVCCVTGVKQAIEIKEQLPGTEVFGFYMDLRMFDRYFEEMYYEAQQKWDISFLRGRLSECAEDQDHSLVLKIEDTLTSRPLKMNVDLLVLLVGFVPSSGTQELASMLGIPLGPDMFLQPRDEHTSATLTLQPGVFLAGAVKGPACISGVIADARAAAAEVRRYLMNLK
jgi:heterodisulfide reductase subunit A